MQGESSQKPVKINANLWGRLDKWLKTDTAKALGYHSKAQFATEAINEYLSIQSGKKQSMDTVLADLIRNGKFSEKDITKYFGQWATSAEENLTRQTRLELKKKQNEIFYKKHGITIKKK